MLIDTEILQSIAYDCFYSGNQSLWNLLGDKVFASKVNL